MNDGNINPFMDPTWDRRRSNNNVSPMTLTLIDFNEQGISDNFPGNFVGEQAEGAVGGVPRSYPKPTIENADRDSDFRPGGEMANQAGRVLIDPNEELHILAENERLRQQALTEHNRMLAAQEEARQVTSEICNENDILRAKLQELGIDPNLDLGLKSTPSAKKQFGGAKRIIDFHERVEEHPQHPGQMQIPIQPAIGPNHQPPKQMIPNPGRANINAFTASGGTEYRDFPPVNTQGRNLLNPTNNPPDARIRFDRQQNPLFRNRDSEGFGGPRFSSTQRQSDAHLRGQARGRFPSNLRNTRFQNPGNDTHNDRARFQRNPGIFNDNHGQFHTGAGNLQGIPQQAPTQPFAPYGRDTGMAIGSRLGPAFGDFGHTNMYRGGNFDFSQPPQLTRPRFMGESQFQGPTQTNFDGQTTGGNEELLPLSVTARYIDPSKLIRSYEGRTDHRTPVGFIREFEQYTTNIQDGIRGKIFVSRLNTAKFRMARSYNHSLGYSALKEQFLASEWDESAREEAIRKIDVMRYDPSKFPSRAEFLVAIYEQLYDCQISIRSLYNKIMRHCPFYLGAIFEEDCMYFDTFAAKVQALQSRFGDSVNDPNIGFSFKTTIPKTTASTSSRTPIGNTAGTFMVQPPFFEEDMIQAPYVMQIGGNLQSNQQEGETQTFEYPGNGHWH